MKAGVVVLAAVVVVEVDDEEADGGANENTGVVDVVVIGEGVATLVIFVGEKVVGLVPNTEGLLSSNCLYTGVVGVLVLDVLLEALERLGEIRSSSSSSYFPRW